MSIEIQQPELERRDWSQCPAVESVPGKVSGAWVFRNTRMPVYWFKYDPASAVLLEVKQRLVIIEVGRNLVPKRIGIIPKPNRDVRFEIAKRF